MGIREEIEKLIRCHIRAYNRILAICYQCEHWQRFNCYYKGTRRGEELRRRHGHAWNELYKALSILDEWECVAEGPLEYVLGQDYSGHRIGEDWVHGLLRDIKNGDHITIYRRKKR